MYRIIFIISLIIRQFYLPNPYESIFLNVGVAILFNLLAGGTILHYLSFTMNGIFYKRGECPSLGSMMYLVWYVINTAIITTIGIHIKQWLLLIVSFIVVYILIYFLLIKLRDYLLFNGRKFD